jgi:beta-glucosidase
MSDWTALSADSGIRSIAAGCDLEMPGPTKFRGRHIMKALDNGEISRQDIERAAGNVLFLVDRTKGLDGPPETPEHSNENPEMNALIRQAGVEGITLLKNERNVLPIKHAQKIAVIGPNARRPVAGGGGSAKVHPYYVVSPYEGIKSAFPGTVLYAQGCQNPKWLPLASKYCETATGEQGVIVEFYKGDRFQGDPVVTMHKKTTDLWLWDNAPKIVLPDYSFRVKTLIRPLTSGMHCFGFSSVGAGRVFLNGELFIDNWDWTEEGEAMFDASQDVLKRIYLQAGVPVELLVESTSEIRPIHKIPEVGQHGYGGCRIGYQEEAKHDLLEEAVETAKEADVAVVIVGLDNEWESEGYDRQQMHLPKNGSQDRLVAAVLKANPNTIVVNQSGTPVTMPWADEAPAILQAWYQGQEAGNALADVLLGKQSPSGKLPTTFPKRLEDNPTYHNWPGENKKVVYGEGIFIGYRHYERMKLGTLFPFGHGLTYTHFSYGEPRISDTVLSETGTLDVSVAVANDGGVDAAEIVQMYIRDVKSRLQRPEKELQGFAKVYLRAGESKVVNLTVSKYSVGYYDTSLQAWIAEEGRFDVLIGASSVDIR